jgi:D-sedoheptulose 7-phosphate isomerase
VGDAGSDEQFVEDHFRKTRSVLDAAERDAALRAAIHRISTVIVDALGRGGKLLIAGNGGSASDAQHIAGEFLSRLNFDRNPLPAIALTTDSSVLTAVGNDYGFDRVFERQLRGLWRQPGLADEAALRSSAGGAVAGNALYPAGPHRRRAHHLRFG